MLAFDPGYILVFLVDNKEQLVTLFIVFSNTGLVFMVTVGNLLGETDSARMAIPFQLNFG